MTTATLQGIVDKLGLYMEVEPISTRNDGEDWGPGTRHFRIVIKRKQSPGEIADGYQPSMIIEYSQGALVQGEPTLSDVFECLALDASGIEADNATGQPSIGFEEWAESYGFDPDSRRAERVYEACIEQTKELFDLLYDASGVDYFGMLVYDTEW